MCDAEIGEDVSENKDEGIVRSQLKKGEGYMMPKEGATCEGNCYFLVVRTLSYFYLLNFRK